VQFKPYFLGLRTDMRRAASCQKCFRTGDIDRVGSTVRHLTFFEMLGNFSFGDYFKEESLAWGWEFITKELSLPADKIYVTIYKGGIAPRDTEAYEIWRKLLPANLRDSHIKELGDKDNFWTMGPTGPCGPSSEIYYDFGPDDAQQSRYGRHECAGVGCDCDRYMEFWNHVFTQFDRKEDGSLAILPKKNIDTGLGLERLATILQGKKSPFATDLFAPIIDEVLNLRPPPPNQPTNIDTVTRLKLHPTKHTPVPNHLNIITDHARACAFLILEGITPSNEGRGYVLRRVIRRAMVAASTLCNKTEPFIYKLAPATVGIFKDHYPELSINQEHIAKTIEEEEKRFLVTLESGNKFLDALFLKCHTTKTQKLSGKDVFHLYETYGFPIELTREIAAADGIALDEQGIEEAKNKAQELAKSKWKGSGAKDTFAFQKAEEKIPAGKFVGYNALSTDAVISGLLDAHGNIVEKLESGASGYVALSATPFYAESGGQVGDTGVLTDLHSCPIAKVEDTQRPVSKLVLHRVKTFQRLYKGMEVRASVSRSARHATACNHTAVHLVNAALREVLGDGVRQAGSYVSSERFRFDYTTAVPPTREDIEKVELVANAAVLSGMSVRMEERPLKDAEALGALTLLGEKYADPARFVLINENGFICAGDRYSLELCGGTHVESTAELVTVRILKDSSLSAGVRRIEGVAGPAAIKYLRQIAAATETLAEKLLVGIEDVPARVEQLLQREKSLRQEIGDLKQKLLSGGGAASAEIADVNGLKLLISLNENADVGMLRGLSDKLRASNPGGAVIAAARREDKISFVVSVAEGAQADACAIAHALAARIGGKGGGRKDFAQGGGDAAHWPDFKRSAVEAAKSAAPAK